MKKAETMRRIAVLIILTVLLSACGAQQSDSRHKVCFVVKSTQTQFWKSAIAGANAARAEYNVDLTVLGPDTEEDFEAQNELIARARKEGAEAIVFSAISYTENAAAIDAAAEAGIKIVVIDSDVDSDRVDVRIGTDNVQAGRMTGMAVLDTDPEALYVGIVNFALGSRNGQEREQGLREVLESDSRVKEIYTVNVPTSEQAARDGALRLITAHPEINTLVGLNEPLAVGTGMAVAGSGLTGQIRVVGFDTHVKCVDMMRDGVFSSLIAQNPYAMGYLGVEYAFSLLEGETFDSSGWIDTSTTIVTQETMFTPEGQKALFSFG